MIIKSDENTFCIPLDNSHPTVLVANGNKETLVDQLNSYFVSKKKNKCMVYEDEKIMKMDDISFIYLSDAISFENNSLFKQKTIMNEEICKIINESPESFHSIDIIRDGVNELMTDIGMNKLREILSVGLDKLINIEVNEININNILSIYNIDSSRLNLDDMKLIVLNLLLYINRYNTNIVFIDTEVSSFMEKVIMNSTKNNYFIIDNESMISPCINYNLLILNNTSNLEITNECVNDIRLLSFINHKLISNNYDLINSKNIHNLNKYSDQNKTFLLKVLD